VISVNAFNHGPAELVIIVPLTTRDRGIHLHVPVTPPEGGLRQQSFIKCEDIRSVSTDRFVDRWGLVSDRTISEVEDRLQILLGM
jgi:mRNA interferase MazF